MPDRLFRGQSEGRWPMWYVSYRLDGANTRMRVFKTRELALKAACQMIGDRGETDVEVGPMLAGARGQCLQGRGDPPAVRTAAPPERCGAPSQGGTVRSASPFRALAEVRAVRKMIEQPDSRVGGISASKRRCCVCWPIRREYPESRHRSADAGRQLRQTGGSGRGARNRGFASAA